MHRQREREERMNKHPLKGVYVRERQRERYHDKVMTGRNLNSKPDLRMRLREWRESRTHKHTHTHTLTHTYTRTPDVSGFELTRIPNGPLSGRLLALSTICIAAPVYVCECMCACMCLCVRTLRLESANSSQTVLGLTY